MPRPEALAALLLGGLLLAACRPAAEGPARLLPELAERAGELERITLAQSGTERVLLRREDRWWIEGEEWPVARRWLDPLLVALLDARCDEPRTARPEHFARLGLDGPPASPVPATGAAFARPTGRLGFHFDAQATQLVIGYPHPRGGTFVRVEGVPGSCLTHADLRLPATPDEWREPALLDPPWQAPEAIGLADADGSVRWLRPEAAADAAAWSAAAALRQIAFRPLAEPLPPPVRRLHLRAADGHERVIELRGSPEAAWARVDAAEPRYAGREFRLPHDVAVPLWPPLAEAGASP